MHSRDGYNRICTQECYHDLSEQESDDEIDRMLGEEPHSAQERRGIRQVRVPTADIDQPVAGRIPAPCRRWEQPFHSVLRNS